MDELLEKAYRPFDIVSSSDGNVGFIAEVSLVQDTLLQYSCVWFFDLPTKTAWFNQDELKYINSLYTLVSKKMCHPFGNSEHIVNKLIQQHDQNSIGTIKGITAENKITVKDFIDNTIYREMYEVAKQGGAFIRINYDTSKMPDINDVSKFLKIEGYHVNIVKGVDWPQTTTLEVYWG